MEKLGGSNAADNLQPSVASKAREFTDSQTVIEVQCIVISRLHRAKTLNPWTVVKPLDEEIKGSSVLGPQYRKIAERARVYRTEG